MNKDVKEKWISALRSGEYKRTINLLHEDNKFCCLGVLCDLAVKEGIIEEPKMINNFYVYGEHQEVDVLPKEVYDWAGLEKWSRNGRYNETDFTLAELNDDGKSFKYIAKVIEKHF